MTEIYETQSERTDLPLVVMPSVLDSMIEPIKAQFPALHDVARVRMFEEFTSDEATIAERLKDADALLVGGYHISDDLLRTISGQGHVKCIVFCGTGVASYLNLDKARELKIRVCNAEHYGDHAVAEHTFALLFELIRRVGQLDKDVKAGNWAWASGDGLQLAGRRMGIIGLGGIGSTVAGIARAARIMTAKRYRVRLEYPQLARFQQILAQLGGSQEDESYAVNVELTAVVPQDDCARFEERVREAFNAAVVPAPIDMVNIPVPLA